MNAPEYLSSCDVRAMSLYVLASCERRDALRKLRLFACACARAVLPLLGDPRSRRAVWSAEEYADAAPGLRRLSSRFDVACGKLAEAHEKAQLAAARLTGRDWAAADMARVAAMPDHLLERHVGCWADFSLCLPPDRQAALLRDIHDPSWEPSLSWRGGRLCELFERAEVLHPRVGGSALPATVQEAWRAVAWLSPQAAALARGLHDAGDFAGAGALADMLEEAGCEGPLSFACGNTGTHSHDGLAGQIVHGRLHETDPRKPHHHHDAKCPVVRLPSPLLAHLRSPGPHARGCVAFDLLLNIGAEGAPPPSIPRGRLT